MPLVLSGGARFAGGIRGSAPAAVVAPPATDSYFMYNSLLLQGNGTNNSQNNTFLDGSTNNFTVTRNGNPTQGTFTPYGNNWGYHFPNSPTGSAGMFVPDNVGFSFGSGDFTVESYINMTASRTGGVSAACVYGQMSNIGNNANRSHSLQITDTSFSFYYTTNGVTDQLITWNYTFNQNTWYHIAVSRSGNTIYGFVNGVLISSQAFAVTISDSSAALAIGLFGRYPIDDGYTSLSFPGYISNLRIVKGTGLYTSTFVPSTTPLTAVSGTVLLTCQGPNFKDNSTNSATITVNGTPSVQRFSPFSPGSAYSAGTIGGSAYFDGSDYLSAGSNSAFAVGTGDFTFRVWVYPTAYTSPVGAIFDTGSGVASGRFSVVLYANGILRVDNNTNLLSSSSALPLNQWTFISIIRSSGTMTMYFNGTSVASGSITNNFTETQGIIGKTVDNYYFQGYISNFSLVKGTALANTVPTTPLTAISGTSLLLSATNAGIIDNAMMNNLETVGNAQISTAQSKFGGSSMYFDGTGDFIYIPASPNTNLVNTWTIECWYQATSRSNTYPAIVSVTDGNSNYANTVVLFDRHNSASTNFSFAVGSGTLTVGTTSVSNGTWYHLALVSNGGTVTLYVNGVSEVSASRTAGSVNKAVYIGANFDYASYPTYLNGYIDDLRITRGYARYTANFTPPAAELPSQ
jgi:hypothetical protein